MKNRNDPFFIIGSGRSGTTLLGHILDNHSRICVPAETHFYNIFSPIGHLYGDLGESSKQKMLIDDFCSTFHVKRWNPPLEIDSLNLNVHTGSLGGVFSAVMSAYSEMQNKSIWGEKTPQHLNHLKEIAGDFSSARYIHLVRDGRDVCMSYMKANFGPKTPCAASHRWKQEIEQIERFKESINGSQYLSVRYEDLLKSPETTLNKICIFLEVDYEKSMLDFHSRDSNKFTEKVNQENLNKPILANNSNKWKSGLNENEVKIFEAISSDVLARYGYALAFTEIPTLTIYNRLIDCFALNLIKKSYALAMHWEGFIFQFPIWKLKIKRRITNVFT